MSQTEVLAIWGAITGTIGTITGLIGLWLRYKQHDLDKAALSCESSFNYESPIHAKHKVTIRSTGRRPVTIDHVRYFITPRKFTHKVIKCILHKKGQWIFDQEPKIKEKLSEGEKTEILISLPFGIEVKEIYKAQIIDQSGRSWPIKWPSTRTLARVATASQLLEVTKENDKRVLRITGHRLGNRYFLETKLHTKPILSSMAHGKSFWFLDKKKYLEKLQDIQDNQVIKFLNAEIEEIV